MIGKPREGCSRERGEGTDTISKWYGHRLYLHVCILSQVAASCSSIYVSSVMQLQAHAVVYFIVLQGYMIFELCIPLFEDNFVLQCSRLRRDE